MLHTSNKTNNQGVVIGEIIWTGFYKWVVQTNKNRQKSKTGPYVFGSDNFLHTFFHMLHVYNKSYNQYVVGYFLRLCKNLNLNYLTKIKPRQKQTNQNRKKQKQKQIIQNQNKKTQNGQLYNFKS